LAIFKLLNIFFYPSVAKCGHAAILIDRVDTLCVHKYYA